MQPYWPRPRALFAVSLVLVGNTAALALLLRVLRPIVEGRLFPELASHDIVWQAAAWVLVGVLLLWALAAVAFGAHGGLFDINWHYGIWTATLLARSLPGAHYNDQRSLMILALGLLYGVRICYNHFTFTRLGSFLYESDWRLLQFQQWGFKRGVPWPLLSLGVTYLSQGAMLFLGSMPIWVVHDSRAPLNAWDYVAFTVTLLAIVGEAIADAQLQSYRIRRQADPMSQAHVLTEGMWAYSRHPNYFFEVLVWCGLAIFAVHTLRWYAAAGCVTMIALFLGYSVPAMDRKMLNGAKNKPDKITMLKRYHKRTSAFVPWFPRRLSPD